MKKALFELVASYGQNSIALLVKLNEITSQIIGYSFGAVIFVNAKITRILLNLIDHPRYNHAAEVIEQSMITTELKILSAISELKQDVLAQKRWTNSHSDQLNYYGNLLANECDWEAGKIHSYMRQVVESIPGLSYGIEDDDEEDEGIEIE